MVRMDWHGYGIDQVDTWAGKIVEAAYLNGYRTVEFVHGAADVTTRGSLGWKGEGPGARGTIKDLLRKRLYGNRWHRWAHERREGMHRIEDGRMQIALRENPKPRKQARWPMVPPPLHERWP